MRITMRSGVAFLAFLAGCPGPMQMGQTDMSPPPATDDVKLAPPAATEGFQLATDLTSVASGQEMQDCYFFKVPDVANGKPFYVSRIEVAQTLGSHHMNLFRQGTVLAPDAMNPSIGLKGPSADGTGVVRSMNGKGACFYSANWADWPLVVNSQVPTRDKNYVLQLPPNAQNPDKVAYKFTPGEILMIQTHFVNATTQVTPGHAHALINLNRLMDETGVQELGTLFATEQSISICKDNPTPKFTGFCKFNAPNQKITIVAANGHFHSRGRDFTICPWDGAATDACTSQKFYESTQWDEPPMATGLDVVVPPGGGIAWTCGFQFEPSPACADGCSCLKDPVNCCYKFGGVVETSEHCNAFVYYYPKIARTDISCQ